MTAAQNNDFPNIEVTKDFEAAMDLITSGAPFVFITGKAGTGKSTFTELLKSKLQNYAVVAPTGVAALNVGGQTIHSFFRIAPGPIDFSKIYRVRKNATYKSLRTLIIDEVSMVRADLLDAIDRMLRLNGPSANRPFGGVQVVAVGDLFQLPPIVTKTEVAVFEQQEYESPFFFSSKALKDLSIEKVEFRKVFRQKEASFISLLNSIRDGYFLEEALPQLNKQVRRLDAKNFDGIVLCGTNSRSLQINASKLTEINSESLSFQGRISGDLRLDSDRLPAPLDLKLKRGAQVMFLKNDINRRWVNGSIGSVVGLTPEYVEVQLVAAEGGHTVRVEAEKWESFKYEFSDKELAVTAVKVGEYQQLPLTLAWAVTIHKSQGKTFDRVHIDLGHGAFAEGQVYVALSRCRTLAGVTLERAITNRDIFFNSAVQDFSAA